jgi:hypothetical protein
MTNDGSADGKDRRWMIELDTRDILAGCGGALVLGGAAWFHPAAAIVVLGAGFCALAWRLSR